MTYPSSEPDEAERVHCNALSNQHSNWGPGKPPAASYIIAHVSQGQAEMMPNNSIAWLADTGCEGVSGITSLKNILQNIQPTYARFDFGGTLHIALETGDLPLGNNQYIRNIHILPNLPQNYNILSPSIIKRGRETHDLVFTRSEEDDSINTAGTKVNNTEFNTFVKNKSLSYIVIPIMVEGHNLTQKDTAPEPPVKDKLSNSVYQVLEKMKH